MSNMLEMLWEQTKAGAMLPDVSETTMLEHKRSFFLGISAAKIVFDNFSSLDNESLARVIAKFERDLREQISILFPDDEYDAPKH